MFLQIIERDLPACNPQKLAHLHVYWINKPLQRVLRLLHLLYKRNITVLVILNLLHDILKLRWVRKQLNKWLPLRCELPLAVLLQLKVEIQKLADEAGNLKVDQGWVGSLAVLGELGGFEAVDGFEDVGDHVPHLHFLLIPVIDLLHLDHEILLNILMRIRRLGPIDDHLLHVLDHVVGAVKDEELVLVRVGGVLRLVHLEAAVLTFVQFYINLKYDRNASAPRATEGEPFGDLAFEGGAGEALQVEGVLQVVVTPLLIPLLPASVFTPSIIFATASPILLIEPLLLRIDLII